MNFIKIGEQISISKIENFEPEQVGIDDSVIDDFKKTAQHLKKIAPKAKDFLYFVATIIHAAEASAYNEDGTAKLTKSGQPVTVGWDNKWAWQTNDPSIKAYRNHNGDIFPESELLKIADGEDIPAYKKWVGKPLCIDHKSSSVDHVRGFIVDTYYDNARKRVVALCALDKVNFPDLARKVSTGYSSNVSMGTGVSTAVCTDCYKQARVEADFCHHMRSKSAYGEINLGLNPIELSIVVTPADPKATIKHVIASMQNYVQLQEQRLNKLSSSSPDMIAALESLKQETQSISSKIEKIIDETMHNQESSGEEDISTSIADSDLYSHTDDSDVGDSTLQLSSINDRLANSEMDRFKQVTASMEAQLRSMEDKINTLSNIIIEKEKEMSDKSQNKTAYFQGGGGVNEPTPGKPKYEKEKMNEDLREEDKHMQVDDMGGRDGLHPGPKSVGMDELDRKKMLARASMEERYLRRKAALEGAKTSLQTQAYHQGTTEPTPGKKQYPVDPLDGQARKLDKHMHGQKPFPDVGKTDGLHPSPDSADESDELKRKQKLSRASYKARFHKAASQGESSWEVLDGDQVVLSATVNEITGDKADLMFDVVATREFGQKLIDKVKVAGASSVKSLFKKAQAPMAPPEELSEGSGTMQAAAPEASAEVTPEASGTMPAQDLGGDGDPKAELEEALTQIQDLSSDALEAYRTLSGEQKEMGDLGMAQMGTTASSRSLFAIRKDLHSELLGSFKTACAELRDYEVELTSIANTYKRGIRKEAKFVVDSTARDALADAKTAIAETCELMEGFVKYMRASTALMRRAQEESQYGDDMSSDDDLMAMIDETDSDLADVKEMMVDDGADPMMAADDDMDSDDEETSSSDDSQDADFSYAEDESDAEDCESSDEMDADVSVQSPDGKTTKVPAGPGTKVTMADYDLTSKAGREAYRAKLASDTIKASPMLDIAHPKGAYKPELSTDSGGYEDIETLDEVHDAMMDMALRQPKVKKEAEVIRQLISEGSIEESELDALVAEGLDKDAVAYYKKMWGSVDGGSEFSSELVKEHVKASMEKDLEVHKAKMARAYNLAHKMAARGFFQNTEAQIASQVDELMRFSDHDFESVKRMIEQKQPVVKTAMPQVGVTNGYADSAPAQGSGSLQDELDQVFSSPKIGRGSW